MKMKIAKANKKGFTLVELVIVIAILAILVAIAIPSISTTINSAKLSTMESDTQTLDMLLKTAVNEMESESLKTMYNGSQVGPGTKVEDVMIESMIPDIELTRNIGNVTYYMVWKNKNLTLSSNPAHAINDTTTLAFLSRT